MATTATSAPEAAPIAQTPASMATSAAGKPTRRRSVRSRDGRKRRTIAAEETGGWASLPDDLVRLVADRVLIAGDVVDYISLRAACSDWRASTDSPLLGGHRHHRARGWAALCDADAARPDDAHEVAFFKPATGRRLRLRLPDLRGTRIVAFSAGLLVLLHKRDTTVRVLHPFTRAVLLDLPSLAPTFRLVGGTRDSLLRMNAAVFTTPAATAAVAIDAVVAWFPGTLAVLFAKPGHAGWDAVILDIDLQSVLAYRGRLYATTKTSTNILQVYPPAYKNKNAFPVDTPIPDALGDPSSCLYFLVQCDGRMLLAVRHYATTPTVHAAFKVFEVDLDGRRLKPVRGGIGGGRALVLGTDRCLAVSPRDLPSISGNSVYCSSRYGVECFSLGGGPAGLEWFAALRSVRPFTIVDHLITYCNHLEWARGLMFHEYQDIPDCLVELKRKIRKQDSQLHIPIREPKKKTSKPSAAAQT